MRISTLCFVLFRFLIPPALICTICLYLYPPLADCSFPPAKPAEAGCIVPGKQSDAVPAEDAPFRLLALGDPQLEGDTSLPDPNAPLFPSLAEFGREVSNRGWDAIASGFSSAATDLFKRDIPSILHGYRKGIDLWGNDLYLAHVYRSVSWWTQPTHTVVVGDLLGSQWVGDEEFGHRTERFWKKVFKGAERVPRTITESSGRSEVLGQDGSWQKRVIAVVGNHDIGYAGDIDEHRIERFGDAYGSVNWEIRFRLENITRESSMSFGQEHSPFASSEPELKLIVLNTMNLDSVAKDLNLQQQSRDFAERQLYGTNYGTSRNSATILLTHIPFHKEAGVCVDAPFFDFWPDHYGGGIKEQNHLSKESSQYILGGLANDRKRGKAIVLNGHDHEGCDTYHFRRIPTSETASDDFKEPTDASETSEWSVKPHHFAHPERNNDNLWGVREITVRSMMGSFGGNAGFLSAWFDKDEGEWKFEYSSCMLGVQHIWWAVHVLDLVVLGLGAGGVAVLLIETSVESGGKGEKMKKA